MLLIAWQLTAAASEELTSGVRELSGRLDRLRMQVAEMDSRSWLAWRSQNHCDAFLEALTQLLQVVACGEHARELIDRRPERSILKPDAHM